MVDRSQCEMLDRVHKTLKDGIEGAAANCKKKCGDGDVACVASCNRSREQLINASLGPIENGKKRAGCP